MKKVELTHDKSIDDNKDLQKQAKHYDNIDLEKEFNFSKAKIVTAKTKQKE